MQLLAPSPPKNHGKHPHASSIDRGFIWKHIYKWVISRDHVRLLGRRMDSNLCSFAARLRIERHSSLSKACGLALQLLLPGMWGCGCPFRIGKPSKSTFRLRSKGCQGPTSYSCCNHLKNRSETILEQVISWFRMQNNMHETASQKWLAGIYIYLYIHIYIYIIFKYAYYQTDGFNPSEKYDFVSWDDDIPFPTASGNSYKIPWF